jgi:hypothetical protein
MPSEAYLRKTQQALSLKFLSIINKNNSVNVKNSGSEAKKRKFPVTFQRIGENMQLLDLH